MFDEATINTEAIGEIREKSVNWDFSFFIDFVCYLQAKLIQVFTFIFGFRKIDVAFISDIRFFKEGDEKKDARLFGYNFKPFRVLPWIQFKLKTKEECIRGQLFMIGMKSHEMRKIKRAQELIHEAIEAASKKGAKIILLAANTKGVFGNVGKEAFKRLKNLYPDIVFTLGDDLPVAFINERVDWCFNKYKLNQAANALVIAPQGKLGAASSRHLVNKGCNIYGLFNSSKGKDVARKRASELGVIPVLSFNELPKIDLTVACGAQNYYELTPEIIAGLSRSGNKLIVVDPCEPPNVKSETLEICRDMIYFRAGNGYNKNFHHILGGWASKLLGMEKHTFWGCFIQTIVLFYIFKSQPELAKKEWFTVTPEKCKLVRDWAKELGFSLAD